MSSDVKASACVATSNEKKKKEKESSKNYQLRRIKEFKCQESLLRTMYLESQGFQTLFSYVMAAVHSFLLIQVAVYFFDRKQLHDDASFLHWAFVQTFGPFSYSWIQIFSLSCLMHPVVRMRLNGILPLPLFVLTIAGYFFLTTRIATSVSLSGVLAAAIASEHTRLMMKVIAYLVSKVKESNQNNSIKTTNTPFSHYLYFLFVPTAVYRDSYPKTGETNWRRVAHLSYLFCLQLVFMVFAIRHWIAPIFQKVGIEPMNIRSLLVFQGTAYALSLLFHQCGMGVALIHCWMNIFAEVLCFGDRAFYQDWWTSTNPLDRLRKWNSVVGDWIYEYLYAALVHVTSGNKGSATIAVFILSAVLHDYVINMMFGLKFVPFIIVTYGGLGSLAVIGLYFVKRTGLSQVLGGYILSNGLDHFATGLAWIIWINFYGFEFYCRRNSVQQHDDNVSLMSSFYPIAHTCIHFQEWK